MSPIAFRHQNYPDGEPKAPYRLLTAPPQPPVDSAEFRQRLRAVGTELRQAGVTNILLMHGTFVGDDYFDLALMLERVSPRLAAWLRRFNKHQPDFFLGRGNYTQEYADRMAEGINEPGLPPIDVRRFIWSGGNSHLPRAMAAVRLIEEIASLPKGTARSGAATSATAHSNGVFKESPVQPRVLCFSHSHGANAVALATNLLGADIAARRQFLDIVERVPGRLGDGHWHAAWGRACQRLNSNATADELLGGAKLDIVTLGIPLRYGWFTGGYGHLLHMINHRPIEKVPAWCGRLPLYGDWVQQLGTAGSNFPLLPLRWRRWCAERRLGTLLQQGEPSRNVLRRIRQGLRVSDEGTTLLIDYCLQPRGRGLRHVFGHGVYTRTEWMPFHLEQTVAEFYVPKPTETKSPATAAVVESTP